MSGHCAACGCTASTETHRVSSALGEGDLDRAIEAGLLEAEPCPACQPRCQAALIEARDARRVALAARERYRARQARLAARASERAARRAEAAAKSPSALPSAAAAALQRALAKAKRP